ncbi:MAG: FecR family protein [Pseudomonadota bacterium]
MANHKRLPLFLPFCLLFFLFLTADHLHAQVRREAGVPAHLLPGNLKDLEIKDYFVQVNQKEVGVIHALNGHVVVIHKSTREAYFGKEGDPVYEEDSLNTLADSRCRVKLSGEDIISMAADTELSVDEFQDRREQGKKRSLFSMVKGKAMFYAMRLFRYKEMRFSLKTPTAVLGVRGTKFGVHVYWIDEENRDEAGIRVADSGSKVAPYLAQVNPEGGGKSFTDCFAFPRTVTWR